MMNDHQIICELCSKTFSSKSNLYQHIRRIHKVEPNLQGNILCPIAECSSGVTTYEKLRNHLELHHSLQIEKEVVTFPDKTAYYAWKDDLERNQNVRFYIETYKSLRNGERKTYLRCHRSGCYSSHAFFRTPSEETCKIGRHCPATIEMTDTGSYVEVLHFKTHVGHALEVKHQKISEIEREEIKRKLSEGVPIERILDDIRDSSSNFERLYYLTRKDIQNIGHSYNLLRPERYHEDDTISVYMFVEKMKELGDASPVAYFKAQGIECNNLEIDDFMLVLFSPPQKNMFEKFYKDKICVDTTHGTNEYNFHLTTVVVVDEFGRGFPAAFCLSNRIAEKQIATFFQAVKDKLPASSSINPKIFMSDDYPAYYNAWVKTMGEAEKQLLCTWHVDKNWRQALSKIKNTEKRPFVYKYLRTLLEESDETKFLALLDKFVSDLDSDVELENFSNYFKGNYLNRCKMWAYCYRQFAGINTNMYLESLHKVIKHVYMQGKVNKRLDKCIYLLQKVIKDKSFDRYTKLIKGNSTDKNSIINSRHRTGRNIPVADIEKISPTEWTVKSQSSNIIHSVKKISVCTECFLNCNICHTCMHEFSCSCLDCSIQGNMCKHIHAVVMNSCEPLSLKRKHENEILNEISQNMPVSVDVATTQTKHQILALKHKFTIGLNLIENVFLNENLPPENLTEANKYMDKALSILQSGNDIVKKSKPQKNEPANKNLPMQRLHSTKKQRSTSKTVLSKPTVAYKQTLLDSINDSDTLAISYGNEHTYSKKL